METPFNKSGNTQEDLPPKTKPGIGGWLKKNLFSSWYNTLLTILFAVLLYFIGKGTFGWFIDHAEWAVIRNNYKLFMAGQYPPDQIWRLWTCLGIISALFGISAGVWKGTARHLAVVFCLICLLHLLMPFISASSKIALAVLIAVTVVGYFAGPLMPKGRAVAIAGWLLSFPVSVFLIDGFGVLTPVGTNLWGGLLLTILLSIVAVVFAFPIGILAALGRTSRLPVIKYFCIIYIEAVRGVPLITVFFMASLVIPLFLPEGLNIDAVIRAMIGATLFTAAYMAEYVRGGLQAIPKGQREAAKAIGLNPVQTNLLIILPQALRTIIPALVGQSISLFKDTSLVSIVGLVDLLGIAQTVRSNPSYLGHAMEVFLFVALVYWVIASAMSYTSRRLERTLGVGKR